MKKFFLFLFIIIFSWQLNAMENPSRIIDGHVLLTHEETCGDTLFLQIIDFFSTYKTTASDLKQYLEANKIVSGLSGSTNILEAYFNLLQNNRDDHMFLTPPLFAIMLQIGAMSLNQKVDFGAIDVFLRLKSNLEQVEYQIKTEKLTIKTTFLGYLFTQDKYYVEDDRNKKAMKAEVEILKHILNSGIKINLKGLQLTVTTPEFENRVSLVQQAIFNKKKGHIKLLLEHGISLHDVYDFSNLEGEILRSYQEALNDKEVVKVLKKYQK